MQKNVSPVLAIVIIIVLLAIVGFVWMKLSHQPAPISWGEARMRRGAGPGAARGEGGGAPGGERGARGGERGSERGGRQMPGAPAPAPSRGR
jgi:hypothetical protein